MTFKIFLVLSTLFMGSEATIIIKQDSYNACKNNREFLYQHWPAPIYNIECRVVYVSEA